MNNITKARIIEVQKSQYVIMADGKEMNGTLAGKLIYQEEYPVVGDYVNVQTYEQGDALITEICERKSYLERPDSGGHGDGFVKNYVKQAMVANLDYLFIVTSLNCDFNVNRMIRYAAVASEGGSTPVLILTKTDICENKEHYIEEIRKINKEMRIICVSSYTGEGIEEVREYMIPGVTIALMGSSGVGKSTLINKIAGREVMKTNGIRESDSKGRHTTTHRQLIDIDGTFIIDTPGMRGFGMCDVSDGISENFSDIDEMACNCKFSDCSHKTEPGCRIKAALEDGSLSYERWELYNRLMKESNKGKAMSAKTKMDIQTKKNNYKKEQKMLSKQKGCISKR